MTEEVANRLGYYPETVAPLTSHRRRKARTDSRTTRQAWLLMGAGVIACIALNLFAPANPTFGQRLYATVLFLACLLPAVWWLRERQYTFPFLPLVSGVYVVYYSVPIFVADHYYHDLFIPKSIPDIYVEEALIEALLGFAAMIVGYYCIRRSWLDRHVVQLRMVWETHTSVQFTAIVLGAAGLAVYYSRFLVALPLSLAQIFRLMADLGLISIAILFGLQLKGKLNSTGFLFLWAILVPTRVLLGFGTGTTFQAVEVVLFLITVYATVRQRFPVRVIGVAFFVLIATLPLRGEFRSRTWSGSEAELSPVKKVGVYVDIFSTLVQGQGMSYSDAIQTSVSRLSHLFTFAEVVEMTPSAVPYWKGETYYPLLFKFVPRFLYPEKPRENTGQDFGHRYGFLGRTDFETSYNLPLLVEWYANFGTAGVGLGMLAIGLFYRLVVHVLTYSVTGIGAVTAAVYIMTRLLVIENSLSLAIGGIVWQVAFLMILNYLIQIGSSGGTRAAD